MWWGIGAVSAHSDPQLMSCAVVTRLCRTCVPVMEQVRTPERRAACSGKVHSTASGTTSGAFMQCRQLAEKHHMLVLLVDEFRGCQTLVGNSV